MADKVKMGSAHARSGAPDLGRSFGRELRDNELNNRAHFVQPSEQTNQGERLMAPGDRPADYPYWMGNGGNYPVAYDADSALKEKLVLDSAVREAADAEVRERRAGGNGQPGVVRTDPISEEEKAYVRSMQDAVELAKFDEYVEQYIDPRKPGNMKWLMEVFPSYVERRLQQAHTDYEFALRNQMIDMWGISTPEDLKFKYQVDQGKLTGPELRRPGPKLDDTYAPGFLSPFNWQTPGIGMDKRLIGLPFRSAKYGPRYADTDPQGGFRSRAGRPMSSGTTPSALARGMYGLPGSTLQTGIGPALPGLGRLPLTGPSA